MLGFSSLAFAQQQPPSTSQQLPDSPKPQNNAPVPLPQAPSAAKPAPEPSPISPEAMPRNPQQTPTELQEQVQPGELATPATPDPNVATVPASQMPASPDPNSRNQLFVLRRQVNFVTVPVTVKDDNGHLVEGLLPKDFSVYENGVREPLKFFTSDPFPLSVAVVLDLGLPKAELSRVQDSLPALVGAFGQFDEVSIFTYANTWKKWQDFSAPNEIRDTTLRDLKAQRGDVSGTPQVFGPLAQSGPVINGRNMDNTPNIPNLPTGQYAQSRVLNDAIVAAAQELARRDTLRRAHASGNAPVYRKVIFIVSDGRDIGSTATYSEVLRVLLSNDITVYSIGLGGAALPIYRKLETINVPRTGTGNILPKYASATGGQVFPELSRGAIEAAYANVTAEARNQYTLGYTTRQTASSAYRTIEVRVNRPNLKVYARDGYYPLPPARMRESGSEP